MSEEIFAFPRHTSQAIITECAGMTLRDWFAGQAVMGLAIGYWNNVNFGKAENLAEAAYEIADAMLKEGRDYRGSSRNSRRL